ncbi:hypothetical protein GCM10010218_14140 [Streptomyces mashuensis]|uniref:Secreted protein n=1 Tax=Streptomyces mashuensis TaxID=33904 RepID=A0A919EC57_9ACTN|nr:SCO2322 family protein [Streptomyces mashuensis]GHF34160.1 hypothetical protein GCM10010218_14140 [Streptomyces mashuensis]
MTTARAIRTGRLATPGAALAVLLVAALAALAALVAGPAAAPASAQARARAAAQAGAQAQGYRYWSFWTGSGTAWSYATEGPGTYRPADGSAVGFRFAVSQDSANAPRPRATPDVAAVCGGTPEEDGHKRVAVVLDFGTPADAAHGETPPEARTACAAVAGDATAAEALAAVAKPLRYDSNALLCGIAGYPRTGCGEKVDVAAGSGATHAPQSSHDSHDAQAKKDSGPSAGLITGIAVVAVLAGAGLWQARRRRRG